MCGFAFLMLQARKRGFPGKHLPDGALRFNETSSEEHSGMCVCVCGRICVKFLPIISRNGTLIILLHAETEPIILTNVALNSDLLPPLHLSLPPPHTLRCHKLEKC